jgi:hypothetical protein
VSCPSPDAALQERLLAAAEGLFDGDPRVGTCLRSDQLEVFQAFGDYLGEVVCRIDSQRWAHIVLPPRTGKTVLAAQIARAHRVLVEARSWDPMDRFHLVLAANRARLPCAVHLLWALGLGLDLGCQVAALEEGGLPPGSHPYVRAARDLWLVTPGARERVALWLANTEVRAWCEKVRAWREVPWCLSGEGTRLRLERRGKRIATQMAARDPWTPTENEP